MADNVKNMWVRDLDEFIDFYQTLEQQELDLVNQEYEKVCKKANVKSY